MRSSLLAAAAALAGLALGRPSFGDTYNYDSNPMHLQKLRGGKAKIVPVVDLEDQFEKATEQASSGFGAPCNYEGPYITCGNHLDKKQGVDYGLFCSPEGECAGEGAACGDDEACRGALMCDTHTHRCLNPNMASREWIEAAQRSQNRRMGQGAGGRQIRCPPDAEVCLMGVNGRHHECVYTSIEVQSCGGCLEKGGQDCTVIPDALATSCRHGLCIVHACSAGMVPNESADACVDPLENR